MTTIYLASDDEITNVIERLRNAEDDVVLVAPKGNTLLQSMINIRLLQKKAEELGKHVSIVTPDPVSKNLVSQTGLPFYATLQDVPQGKQAASRSLTNKLPEQVPATNSSRSPKEPHHPITVKRYDASSDGESLPESQPVAEPIRPEPGTEQALTKAQDTPDEEVIMGEQTHHSTEEEPAKHRSHPKLRPHREPIRLPSWLPFVLVAVAVLLIGGMVAGAATLPETSITLHVPAEALKQSVSLTIDPNLTTSQGSTIPGLHHEASADATGTAKATGKKEVGDKAKGTITISNLYSTSAVTVPSNTNFVSADKKLVFKSQADTSVPGESITKVNGQLVETAGKADVSVEADQPGDQYNLTPTSFTVQGQPGLITGASSKAMTGGTTKELTVVAAGDIDQAKNDAKTQSTKAAVDALSKALNTDEILLQTSIKQDLSYKDPDHAIGDVADQVIVGVTTKATGLAYRVSDSKSALTDAFQPSVPSSKSLILPDTSTITWNVDQKSDGSYILQADVTGQLVASIAERDVQTKVRGKNSKQIAGMLEQDFGATSVDVQQKPDKWPFVPWLASRIHVTITE